jgi:hypothetical protein
MGNSSKDEKKAAKLENNSKLENSGKAGEQQ